jgi:hypothetical protein
VHSLAGFNLADELITRPPYSDPLTCSTRVGFGDLPLTPAPSGEVRSVVVLGSTWVGSLRPREP